MLNESQQHEFWRHGVVTINDILTPDEVAELITSVDLLSDDLRKEGSDEVAVHLQEITIRNSIFRSLAKSPKLTSAVASLLGPDLQLHHSKLATKPPQENKGGVCWHQDFPFFPHTNTSLVAVMVMLDDATPLNGCMYVIPGSHKLGPLDHHIDGWFTRCCQESLPENITPSSEADLIAVTPSAGGISIHHCLALHCSPPNLSDNRRRGLVFQYRTADAVQLSGGPLSEIPADCGWQVSGTDSGYVRCEEAAWKLPKRFSTVLTNDVHKSETIVEYLQYRPDVGYKTQEWNSSQPKELVSKKAIEASAFALPEGQLPSLNDLIPIGQRPNTGSTME